MHKMLLAEYVGYSLVEHILPCLHTLYPIQDSLVNYLAETVAEIREPITEVRSETNAEDRRKMDVQVNSFCLAFYL